MAITEADLAAGTACYDALTPDQKRAFKVYGKVLTLFTLTGTDYRSTLTTTLLSDAATLTKGMGFADLEDADLWLQLRSGANPVPSIATTMTAVKRLVEADPLALKRAEVLLDSKIAAGLVA